jgi:pimeloyl-ACP methyl ester carboxylesterase
MPYADLDALKLYYEEYGPDNPAASGNTPLVFLHGFTLDRRMWAPQARFFRKEYRVILLDSRGHGLSDAPQSGYSRAHRVEDLQQFIDRLGIERFHLIGLSMGGSTAIGYALKHQQRLATLTLVSTGAAGYNIGKKISRIDQVAKERGVDAARRKWIEMTLSWYRQDKNDIKALLARMMDEHSGAVWLDPMRGKYPRENDLDQVHTITVPTKIIAGSLDRVFLTLARLLHQRMPTSSLSVYDGIGHMVTLEAPGRFNRELKEFIETHR